MRNYGLAGVVAVAIAGIAACESAKSSNPLSPSVAGPIPGVTISAPKLLEPAAGWELETGKQPLTLLIENASTTGARPLTYLFEISTDAQFGTRVFTREGVTPGENGRTSLKLPDALASDRSYYWRARAQDGANTGPYSSPVAFVVYTPVVIEAPVPLSPVPNEFLTGRRVTLVFRNAVRSGPVGTIRYTVQMATDEPFIGMVAQLDVAEQSTQTQAAVDADLPYDAVFYWRVRAYETSKNLIGPWSITRAFQTPSAPPPPPPPTPTPTPTPTPPSGGWPSNGPDVIDYVESHWPGYLAAGVSSSQRRSNMEFIRDRIIETGICGGMNLGWNLKRGGPEISADYITYNTGGRWIGVDIAYDYDNTSQPLRLQWAEVTNDPYTTPGTYSPRPSCR